MEERDEVKKHIKMRIDQFRDLGKKGHAIFDFRPYLRLRFKADVLSELVFCISTANSSASAGLEFQNMFCKTKDWSEQNIFRMLHLANVRFPRMKAKYIAYAINEFPRIQHTVLHLDSMRARELLVEKIKGMGYKEASHFLRNIGREDVAILDRHILRWLVENNYLGGYPKNLTRGKYMEIENLMKDLARKEKMSLSELDLYLWYSKTGKVLK